jgi:hypothetical protein
MPQKFSYILEHPFAVITFEAALTFKSTFIVINVLGL